MSSPSDADPPQRGSLLAADHPPVRFPDPAWEAFAAAVQSLDLPLEEDRRAVFERLYGHLLGVNRFLNLTRLTAPEDFLQQHVLDSLLALGDRRLRHLGDGARCCDLGTGGGYPGLPLALWLPRQRWFLADSRAKKVAFVAEAIAAAGLANASAVHCSGARCKQMCPDLLHDCQIVVTRAVGPCRRLFAEAAPLLKRHGHLLVYKGPEYREREREGLEADAQAAGYRLVSDQALPSGPLLGTERVLVVFQRQ